MPSKGHYFISDGLHFVGRDSVGHPALFTSKQQVLYFRRQQAAQNYLRLLPSRFLLFPLQVCERNPPILAAPAGAAIPAQHSSHSPNELSGNDLIFDFFEAPPAEEFPLHPETLDELYRLLIQLEELSLHLIQKTADFSKALSTADQAVNDLYHLIEFCSPQGAEDLRVPQLLRRTLLQRRACKDSSDLLNLLLSSSLAQFASGKVSEEARNLQTCKYRPRILKDLFPYVH